MTETTVQSYPVPVRAVWQARNDLIELRVLTRLPFEPEASRQEAITVHVGLGERILAVSVPDNKHLRLGQWLRQHWASVTPPTGEVEIQVYYDEPGRVVHFAFDDLELLERDYVRRALRTAEFRFSAEGHLCAILIPVRYRRRRDGELSASAGYLTTR